MGDGDIWFLGILVGAVIGIIIGGFLNGWGNYEDISRLGKAICEEEYDMDFESYVDGTLRCKPFTESYDGIKVEVPKAQLKTEVNKDK